MDAIVNGKPVFEHAQVQQQLQAGNIDHAGVGIALEYPKMLYKAGKSGYLLGEQPFKIDGKDLETKLVNSPDEEADAIADGWFYNTSLTKTAEQTRADEDRAKDAEIERLRALAGEGGEQKRGPGRPPRQPEQEV